MSTVARTALRAAASRRNTATALATADACLAQVVSGVPAGWDFDAILRGPDGVLNTVDDGQLTAPSGCTARFGLAPGAATPARGLLTIDARTTRSRRLMSAVVRRAPGPGVAALLWTTNVSTLGTPSGTLEFDGTDHANPARPSLASLAAPNPASQLDAWLTALGPQATVAAGTAPPLVRVPPPGAELIARAQQSIPVGTPGLVTSPPAPIAAGLSTGDLRITGATVGQGLLVVDGWLDVEGPFDFRGVVIARAGVRVHAGATAAVHGALWVGPAGGAALDVAGRLRIDRDDAGIAVADTLLVLPRLPMVAGILDAG
jgi:hypothetical protein